jgi:hypothetical protein
MLFVLVPEVVEVEESIPTILALSSKAMEVLVVAAVIIVFEVCCLLFLVVALLLWGRRALWELVILAILLIQLMAEMADRRLSMELHAVRQGVRAAKESSRTRSQSRRLQMAETEESETGLLQAVARWVGLQVRPLLLALEPQVQAVKTGRSPRT